MRLLDFFTHIIVFYVVVKFVSLWRKPPSPTSCAGEGLSYIGAMHPLYIKYDTESPIPYLPPYLPPSLGMTRKGSTAGQTLPRRELCIRHSEEGKDALGMPAPKGGIVPLIGLSEWARWGELIGLIGPIGAIGLIIRCAKAVHI